jgi:DNA-binding XRE family transcriptional regulator
LSAASREAQALLDKLTELSQLIEAHRATLYMLERERMQLQTQLAQSGYRPQPQGELL